MENLLIYNDNITLYEFFQKIDKGRIIVDTSKEVSPTIIESVFAGLYNPVIWSLEDYSAIKHILFRDTFILTLYKFYKGEIVDNYSNEFGKFKPKLQSKFEDRSIVTRTVSYHPDLDKVKIIQLLENGLV